MKSYIGEIIWLSGLAFVIFVLLSTLGGCCHASIKQIPGSQEILSPEFPEGRKPDKGP